ncbi:MAG TPA: tyrosine-type recombinase/integrase [Ktedonobacterales bacterium]|nr:tyrosine-type recombinase/integrase [Ktedonobacterales bacterium]
MTGDSRQEVQRLLAHARRELEQGLAADTARRPQTVAQYLLDWLASKAPDLAPKTAVTWEGFMRLHLVPAFHRTPLTKLSPQQVQRAYAMWREQGLSSTTVGHLHAVLKHALSDAIRLGLMARNPLDAIKRPKANQREMRVLTEAQAQTLIAACQHERLGALIVMALSTGMRQGEMLGLRWKDVDLDGHRLRVHVNLQHVKGADGITRPILKAPKTPHSNRTIVMTPGLVDALRSHRQRQRLERLALGPAWSDQDLVFCNEVGRPCDPKHIGVRLHHRLLAACGLPRIRFHDLRHTAATLLISRGVNPKVVSEMLGHASIAITLQTYTHVQPHMQQAASDAMQVALWGQVSVDGQEEGGGT